MYLFNRKGIFVGWERFSTKFNGLVIDQIKLYFCVFERITKAIGDEMKA